jgi:hypothetical protein
VPVIVVGAVKQYLSASILFMIDVQDFRFLHLQLEIGLIEVSNERP